MPIQVPESPRARDGAIHNGGFVQLANKDEDGNLDISWLKDESLEDSANLPAPDIIAAEIVKDLQAALAQFAEIASHSENAVHTPHSQLCSPKAHRVRDPPGSATPATDRRKDSRAAATNYT